MTDSPDSSRLLASAAFDNEATADELAQVAASAPLTAELGVFRTLRDEISDVEIPAAAREAGIAAALAVFDTLRASSGGRAESVTVAAVAVAPVVSLAARRQRQYKWIGGAAAAAIVALVGVVVIKGATQDDHKSVSLPSTTAVDGAIQFDTAGGAATGAGNETSASMASKAAITVPVLADSAATDSAAAGAPPPAAAAATVTPSTTGAPFDPWATAPSFTSEAEFLAYAAIPGSPLFEAGTIATTSTAPAANSTAETTAGTSAASISYPASPDPGSNQSAAAAFAVCSGSLSQPSVPVVFMGQRVIAVRDDAAGQFAIIDPVSCTIIGTIPIP